jgi:hypothetical protein
MCRSIVFAESQFYNIGDNQTRVPKLKRRSIKSPHGDVGMSASQNQTQSIKKCLNEECLREGGSNCIQS